MNQITGTFKTSEKVFISAFFLQLFYFFYFESQVGGQAEELQTLYMTSSSPRYVIIIRIT